MPVTQSLYISPIGLSMGELKVLTVATKLLVLEGVNCVLLDADDSSGNVAVIDAETKEGKAQLALSAVRKDQIKVIFGSPSSADKNEFYVAKPLRVSPLKDLLYQICTGTLVAMTDEARGTSENIITQRAISQDPGGKLFQVLLHAKQQQKSLEVNSTMYPDVLVDGITGAFAIAGHQEDIDTLYMAPLDKIVITEISSLDFAERAHGLAIWALDRVLWRAGILSSNGRLLPGLSADEPITLTAWPSFSGDSFNSNHFKLATALVHQALTLDELIHTTQVPTTDAVSFYNAAYAVGLTRINSASFTKKSSLGWMSRGQKILFGKLAGRLGFG